MGPDVPFNTLIPSYVLGLGGWGSFWAIMMAQNYEFGRCAHFLSILLTKQLPYLLQ